MIKKEPRALQFSRHTLRVTVQKEGRIFTDAGMLMSILGRRPRITTCFMYTKIGLY